MTDKITYGITEHGEKRRRKEKRAEYRIGWRRTAVCALSGALCAACFYVPWGAILMWVLPAPALVLIFKEGAESGRASLRRMVKLACAFTLTFFFCSYLVGFTIDVYFAKPIMMLLDLGLISVATLLQGIPQIAALCIGSRLRLPKRKKGNPASERVIAVAVLWTAAEWLTTVGPFAFPVRTLAVSQWKFTPFIQTSSIFGELFISFLIMITSGLLAAGWMAIRAQDRKRFVMFGASALAVFVFNFAIGALAMTLHNAYVADDNRDAVRILAIQHNQPSTENDYIRFENAYAQASSLLETNDVDLLVFPESTAQFVRDDDVMRSQLSSLAERYDIDIIVGGANRVSSEAEDANTVISGDAVGGDGDGDGEISEGSGLVNLGKEKKEGVVLENAVHMFTRDGEMQDYYYVKQQLVPFFENGNIQKFSFFSGDERGVFFTSDDVRIGTIVCFESVLQETVRDTVWDGADIILIPSNDAYLGEEIRTMHIAQSVFRAIETRRAVVQVATNGVTAYTAPNGKMITVPMNEQTELIAEVYPSDRDTAYKNNGNMWLLVMALVLAVDMIRGVVQRRKKKGIAESTESEL